VIIIDFSKAFDSVPHDWLITKIVASGVDSRVVMWVREFLLGHSQKVRVGGQLSEVVRVMSVVPHRKELGPHLLLAYVNDIWRNTESTVRLFADDCIIHRKIMDGRDI
jgi:hypothetical protein